MHKGGGDKNCDRNGGATIESLRSTALIQVSRHQKGFKEKSRILQPNTVYQYNKNMGGVDQHDCLLEKHTIQILGKEWYSQIFTKFIDMAIVNTYILVQFNKLRKEKYKRHPKIYRRCVPQTGKKFQDRHWKTSDDVINIKRHPLCV
ncbi:piggyBac transposable element-derived protein 3 [Trichonephila clavipes]|nr:piggyBac transposable element-derived protein 3 [Trichonephila clavipes]